MKVDFPHPEGPIMAVTALAFTVRFMSFKACFEPNHAFNAILCIFASGRTCSKLTVVSLFYCSFLGLSPSQSTSTCHSDGNVQA